MNNFIMKEKNSYNLTKKLERSKNVDYITDKEINFCYSQADIEKGKDVFGLKFEDNSLILGNDDAYHCPAKGMRHATDIPYMKSLIFFYRNINFSNLTTTLVGRNSKYFKDVVCDSLYFNGTGNIIILDNFTTTNDSLSINLNADMIVIKDSIIDCDNITLYGKVVLEDSYIRAKFKYNIPNVFSSINAEIVRPKRKVHTIL